MRSTHVLDHRFSASSEVRDLLVLWQHPTTREIMPIGRFARDRDTYTFAYTRAAAQIPDFRPLPGLRNLDQWYVAPRMPAVFEQRVMDPHRPDYADYLDSIGLDPAHATPWEQIVHSEGRRAGDTLQFMRVPTVIGNRARARFLANGVRHIPTRPSSPSGRTMRVTPEQQEAALNNLASGATVLAEPEHANSEDANAVLITTEGVPVGYVPRILSTSVRELMATVVVTFTVVRVGQPGTPPHLRLVLDLDAPAPDGFSFDRDGMWAPLHSTPCM